MEELLRLEQLTVRYHHTHTAQYSGIENINLSLKAGEICGIIGESGGGKTTVLSAIMGILPHTVYRSGKIIYKGKEIQQSAETELQKIRFHEIGLVFQNQADYLNPALTVGEQILEILRKAVSGAQALQTALEEVCTAVGLDSAYMTSYPHELSGGMRQRVFIAMALCLRPPLLLIDEPTTALDPESKKHILNLLRSIHKTYHTAMLIVSHDLEVIEALSENLCVLLRGTMVEKGKTRDILEEPKHPYTFGLLQTSSYLNPWKDLWGIKEAEGEIYGCPFYQRCTQRIEACMHYQPCVPIEQEEGVACIKHGIEKILEITGISKTFPFSGKTRAVLTACSLRVRHGEITALLGKSGSGKTTLLRIIAGLLQKDSGDIYFLQKKIGHNTLLSQKEALQMVEQDCFSSMNGMLTVEDIVAEPSVILYNKKPIFFKETVKEYLKNVGFDTDDPSLKKTAQELSGGQRQKIALARALSMEPHLLLADEITAMLDDASKVRIMRLLKQLQHDRGFSVLFVTHDERLVKKTADYVYCIEAGRIIKEGSVRNIFREDIVCGKEGTT